MCVCVCVFRNLARLDAPRVAFSCEALRSVEIYNSHARRALPRPAAPYSPRHTALALDLALVRYYQQMNYSVVQQRVVVVVAVVVIVRCRFHSIHLARSILHGRCAAKGSKGAVESSSRVATRAIRVFFDKHRVFKNTRDTHHTASQSKRKRAEKTKKKEKEKKKIRDTVFPLAPR